MGGTISDFLRLLRKFSVWRGDLEHVEGHSPINSISFLFISNSSCNPLFITAFLYKLVNETCFCSSTLNPTFEWSTELTIKEGSVSVMLTFRKACFPTVFPNDILNLSILLFVGVFSLQINVPYTANWCCLIQSSIALISIWSTVR